MATAEKHFICFCYFLWNHKPSWIVCRLSKALGSLVTSPFDAEIASKGIVGLFKGHCQ